MGEYHNFSTPDKSKWYMGLRLLAPPFEFLMEGAKGDEKAAQQR